MGVVVIIHIFKKQKNCGTVRREDIVPMYVPGNESGDSPQGGRTKGGMSCIILELEELHERNLLLIT